MRPFIAFLTLSAIPAAAQSADYSLPPLSDVTAIVERPLFDAARRGAAPATVTGMPMGESRLIGVVVRGNSARALLMVAGTARSLTPGEMIGEWRLLSVEAGAAHLAGTDGRQIRLAVGDVLP